MGVPAIRPIRPVKYTSVTETQSSVGTAAAELLAANTSRVYLSIQNTHGSQSLHLSFDGGDATTSDIKLTAGSSMTFETTACPTGSVSCIGSGAATTYAILQISE